MITKLTLTLEEETIAEAKKYAKERGKSLSALVESYFSLLTNVGDTKTTEGLTENVKNLYGSVSLPGDFDYKSELEKAIHEKHNL